MMKKNASILFKHIISVLRSMAKGKSIAGAIKSKADAVKARLLMSALVKGSNNTTHNNNNKLSLMKSTISHKIHALMLVASGGQQQQEQEQEQGGEGAIVVYKDDQQQLPRCSSSDSHHGQSSSHYYYHHHPADEEEDDDDNHRYPDLTHSLFDEEKEEELEELLGSDPNGSVIELVRNSKEVEGQHFSLEDEIDHVADLFITKFHKRMRLQKLESFKRLHQMLHRST